MITRLYLPATPQTWLSMDYTRSVNHLVCYFSGTGNTQNAAGHIAAALEKQGHGTSLLQIEDPGEEVHRSVAECDVLVLLFPVYSWAPPAVTDSLPPTGLAAPSSAGAIRSSSRIGSAIRTIGPR